MKTRIIKLETAKNFAYGITKALGFSCDRKAFDKLNADQVCFLLQHPIFEIFRFPEYAKLAEDEPLRFFKPVISADELLLHEYILDIEENPDNQMLYTTLYNFFIDQHDTDISEDFLLREFMTLNPVSPDAAILVYLFYVINKYDLKSSIINDACA